MHNFLQCVVIHVTRQTVVYLQNFIICSGSVYHKKQSNRNKRNVLVSQHSWGNEMYRSSINNKVITILVPLTFFGLRHFDLHLNLKDLLRGRGNAAILANGNGVRYR